MKTSKRLERERGPGAVVDVMGVSPRNGNVPCEEDIRMPQDIRSLSREGRLDEVAWNCFRICGQRNRFEGDFHGTEGAGVPFRSDRAWLPANLPSPGGTFAISGPWEELGL